MQELKRIHMHFFMDLEHDGSQTRIKNVSILCTVLMGLTYLIAGYWYVVYYNADECMIEAGPWAFGDNFFTEVKEHVFLMLLLLAVYLPIAARGLLHSKANRRTGRPHPQAWG